MKYTIELFNQAREDWERIPVKPELNTFDSIEEAEETAEKFLDNGEDFRIIELE